MEENDATNYEDYNTNYENPGTQNDEYHGTQNEKIHVTLNDENHDRIDYVYPASNDDGEESPFLLSDLNTRDILYHDIVETNATETSMTSSASIINIKSTETYTVDSTETYTVDATATPVESYQAVVDQNHKLVDILQSTLEMQAYLLDKIVAFFIK